MLAWSQTRFFVTLAVAALLVMEPVSWITAPIPGGCIVNPENYAAYYSGHNDCPTFHVFLIDLAIRIFRHFGDPNWVIADFTAVLAFSTICLWVVTWRASVRQSRDMEASIAVASKAADAALMHAKAAIAADSPIPVVHQIKLVQYAGAASENVIRDPVPLGPIPDFSRILIWVGNEGRTVLRLTELCIEQLVAPQLPEERPTYTHVEALGGGLRTGQSLWFRSGDLISRVVISDVDSVAVTIEASYYWVYGYVGYLDLLGQRQQHRFLARWNVHAGFVPEQRANYT